MEKSLEQELEDLMKDLKWQVTFDSQTFDFDYLIETANRAKKIQTKLNVKKKMLKL